MIDWNKVTAALKAFIAAFLPPPTMPQNDPQASQQPIPQNQPQTPLKTPPTAPQGPSTADILHSDIMFTDWVGVDHVRHNMRVVADQLGLSALQKDLLCDICSCEGGFKPDAKLVNSPHSIDRGLFQWNNYYHPEITDEMAYNPDTATRLACKAILNKQTHVFWSASEHCWNRAGKYDSLL